MRWPWQRERPEPGPEASAPEVEAQAAPDSANRATVPPEGWAFLPPLQRTVGTMDLAHGPDRFVGSLAAWANPSFTGPMSHLVSADAPPGVIDVDGGGTGTGEAYRSEPADMTLLIPPARSRPAGGLPTAVQRTSSADDAPDGASSVAGVPDGIGVLRVEAVPTPAAKQSSGRPQAPMQPTAPVQRSAAGAQPSPPQPQAAQTAESAQTALPEGDTGEADSGPPQAAEWPKSAWDTVAPPRPNSGGSTSDGNATYVPLPAPAAIQRATDRGPDSPRASREATPFTYPSRLGLGRPLSFAKPESSDRPIARVSDVPEPLRPVQRVHEPGPSAEAAPAPPELSVAEALKAPDSPSAQSIQATDASGHGDARNNGDAPSQGGADNATAVRDHEGPGEQQLLQPPPAEEPWAPLLSNVMGPATTSPSEDSRMERHPLQGSQGGHTEGAADLPVVSRLAADKQLENDGGPTLRETAASLLQPDDPHHDVSADNSGPADDARGPDLPSTSVAGEAPILSRGLLGDERADGPPAQSGVPVQAGIPVHGGIAVQRDTGHGRPAVARALPIPESTAVAGRLPGANGTPRAGTGAMQGLESAGPTQSAALSGATVQRADQAAVDTAAHWSGSRAGAADLRASRPVTPGSTPRTWQRMTAMPPAVQQRPAGDTPPAFQAGAGTAASLAFGGDPPGRTGADSATDATGSGEPDRMSADFPSDAGTGYKTGPALQTEPEYGGGPDPREVTEPPAPSAAVGSVIQRTLTLDTSAAQAPDGSPSPGMPFRANRAAMPWQGSGAQALQRMPAFPGSVPVRTASYPVTADLPGPAGQPVVHSAAQYPVALRLAPAAEPVVDGPASQGRDLNAVQRDSLPGSPDAAVPPAAAPVTAPPEVSGASSAVEANREEPPPGPAPPGPERSAGAPGVAGAATPDQLEELAKRLAGPLIRRIKAEMLLDRERRGLRTDSN